MLRLNLYFVLLFLWVFFFGEGSTKFTLTKATCKEREYIHSDTCYECLSNCVTCTSYDNCTKCQPGKWGRYCHMACRSSVCTNNVCNVDDGHCAPTGNRCDNCNTCIQKTCISCIPGYYLVKNKGYCARCPFNCDTCIDSLTCVTCKPGYFGWFCQDKCFSSLCPYNKCDYYGHCVMSNDIQEHCLDYSSSRGACLQCKSGYYVYNGYCAHCRDGCDTCVDLTCTRCQHGYWGRECTESCPPHVCVGNECTIEDGTCFEREDCANCMTCPNKTCVTCQEGYYLLGDACYQCQSNCTACSSYYTCSTCKLNYHGNACQYYNRCSETLTKPMCKHNVCTEDGYCLYGCGDGFYPVQITDTQFLKCFACPKRCVKCQNELECYACEPHWYGRLCDLHCHGNHFIKDNNCYPCPTGCRGCDNATVCSVCKDTDKWGQLCDRKCGHCKGISCFKYSGVCCQGCTGGYQGGQCNEPISKDDAGMSRTELTIVIVVIPVAVIVGFVVVAVVIYRRVWKHESSVDRDDNPIVDHEHNQYDTIDGVQTAHELSNAPRPEPCSTVSVNADDYHSASSAGYVSVKGLSENITSETNNSDTLVKNAYVHVTRTDPCSDED